MNEKAIAQRALKQLEVHTGIKGKWLHQHRDDQEVDGKIAFYLGGKDLNINVEVKKELRQYQIPAILEKARSNHPFMVVAEQIFPTLKKQLRENRVAYLDLAGNIFIDTDDKHVWIDGHKHETREKPVTNRAFTKTGLKTVFYLLLYNDAVNMPYRHLAHASDVALGNIKNVMEGLRDAGFILQLDDNRKTLRNKKQLLKRWIAGYGETLKPALHLGTYKFWNDDFFYNWQNLPHRQGTVVWGGEAAAEVLTKHLNPAILTAYLAEDRSPLVAKWRLLPTTDGNLQLYQKFWQDENETGQLTPPLLVYADLMLTDDPRCLEAAETIYNQYLSNEFDKF